MPAVTHSRDASSRDDSSRDDSFKEASIHEKRDEPGELIPLSF
ncbi:hypothetical protein RSSM_05401 [Rhodopirellula sallentina SM41]|uniref:Uncharacterized protein n=1 Tax=Rhodopirellula sallentina SM41 TaxID=1263870 RepID=M5TVG1_9BACT|nr:hypothetical protein RSSM_05401 [Rhodopirellula sallentina SM41]